MFIILSKLQIAHFLNIYLRYHLRNNYILLLLCTCDTRFDPLLKTHLFIYWSGNIKTLDIMLFPLLQKIKILFIVLPETRCWQKWHRLFGDCMLLACCKNTISSYANICCSHLSLKWKCVHQLLLLYQQNIIWPT